MPFPDAARGIPLREAFPQPFEKTKRLRGPSSAREGVRNVSCTCVPEGASSPWSPRFHPSPPFEGPSIANCWRGVKRKEIGGEVDRVASFQPHRDRRCAPPGSCGGSTRLNLQNRALTPMSLHALGFPCGLQGRVLSLRCAPLQDSASPTLTPHLFVSPKERRNRTAEVYDTGSFIPLYLVPW